METTQEQVNKLEQEMLVHPQMHCPIRHYLAGGLYAREITIPAGVCLVGAVHRHEHLCTVSQGRLLVTTDEGVVEVAAPATLVSKPGAKRAGYALETTVWTTYHWVGDETDLDKITEEILECTRAELLGGDNNLQARTLRIMEDRRDYLKFLREYGVTEEAVKAISHNFGDHIDIPLTNVTIRDSEIEGMGMFVTRAFAQGERIVPARIGNRRTLAGRTINHSCRANVVFVPDSEDNLTVVALRPIQADEELTVDYRQVLSVNDVGLKPIEEVVQ